MEDLVPKEADEDGIIILEYQKIKILGLSRSPSIFIFLVI